MMAKKDNAQGEISSVQAVALDDVSTIVHPPANTLIQPAAADQAIITAISQAVLAAIQPSLHVVDQTTNTNVVVDRSEYHRSVYGPNGDARQ